MNYPQYRKARRLTRECCNNVGGNCLLLDDGEECICVQSISYSLLGQLYAEVQPGEILSRLRQENAPPKRGRTTEEKIPPSYAFRGVKARCFQGFQRLVGGVAE